MQIDGLRKWSAEKELTKMTFGSSERTATDKSSPKVILKKKKMGRVEE